ncbi:unnamed protein product [Choristocarpus tenellus]
MGSPIRKSACCGDNTHPGESLLGARQCTNCRTHGDSSPFSFSDISSLLSSPVLEERDGTSSSHLRVEFDFGFNLGLSLFVRDSSVSMTPSFGD